MLTFNELIKNNIAPSPYKTNVIDCSSDRICINYNNIWGILTDTHMSKGENGKYYITGSLLKDKNKTIDLVHSSFLGNCFFRDASVNAYNLLDYVHKNHLLVAHSIVNGDDVLELTPMTDDEIKWYEENNIGNNKYCCAGCFVDNKLTKNDKDMSKMLCFDY
mgnify:CR=1 FL=1